MSIYIDFTIGIKMSMNSDFLLSHGKLIYASQTLPDKDCLSDTQNRCGLNAIQFAQHAYGCSVLVGNAAQGVSRLDFVRFVLRFGQRLLIGQPIVRVNAEIVLFDGVKRIA